jgi:hypothetical protein
MRRVKQERPRDQPHYGKKLGIEEMVSLLSRDAKEGDKSKFDGALEFGDSGDERTTKSRDEGEESGLGSDVDNEGIGELLRQAWRAAPRNSFLLFVSLMLTVVVVACQDYWLPMMGLRLMKRQ